MKKYIPLDFDEKGKVILGREKNTPTPNGTIPAIFIPGGSDENKQGLKSITVSPAITTTPALDSLFPIYWEDLTDEQKESGITLNLIRTSEYEPGEYTITAEPTNDWYAGIIGWESNPQVSENAGESATASITPVPPSSFTVAAMSSLDDGADMVKININIESE